MQKIQAKKDMLAADIPKLQNIIRREVGEHIPLNKVGFLLSYSRSIAVSLRVICKFSVVRAISLCDEWVAYDLSFFRNS